MKLGLLALDSRPCTSEQTEELARLSGFDVSCGPLSTTFEERHRWLIDVAPSASVIVLSFDQWIYGGLLESRTLESCTLSEGFKRLAALAQVIEQNPQTRFYISSVLLRLSLTVTDAASEKQWRDLFQFSVISDGGTQSEIKAAADLLPSQMIQAYLAVRARNHALSLSLVKLAGRSAHLWFGQEDCGPRGLHRREKLALFEAIRVEGASERVTILTGADELGATAVLAASRGSHSPQRLKFFTPELSRLDEIGLFEDIPAIENLRLHAAAGAYTLDSVESAKQADFFVMPFLKGGQLDGCFEQPELDSELERLGEEIPKGVACLDLSTGNGAHPSLMRGLARSREIQDLPSFSAWNTVGNRAGTFFHAFGFSEKARKQATLTRLLDDWIYQAEVRPELQAIAKARGWNSWSLTQEATTELEKIATELTHRKILDFGGTLLAPWQGRVRVELPWKRLFEARLSIL